MKTLALFIVTACMLAINLKVFAQQHNGCGFDIGHRKLLQTNPQYKAAVEHQEAAIKAYAQQTNNARVAGGIYIMPVVVHVVHTGGLSGSIYNPTDDHIRDVIAYLNDVYAGTDPDQNGEGVGDIGIRFELASRDPNCNPTNGINHINGSSLPGGYATYGIRQAGANGVTDANLKSLIRWDASRYCNIWVVDKIDGIDGTTGGGVAGYAFFPFSASVDGIVIRAADMAAGNTTLPHEMGHVFALYHPFEGSSGSTCPANANPATDGDKITDTDPVTNPNFASPERSALATPNPCTGLAYNNNTEHNIMSYIINPRLFTAGQRTRMLNTITANAEYGTYRIMQINSNGDYTPDQGPSVCAANKMSFELSEYRVAEQTSATASAGTCNRKFSDHTFNLMIGKAPTATATATLTTSGAIEGVDFDISAGSSYTTSSKTITFPTGTNASQPFTVRVYDDASVNTNKIIALGFTVSGGDAVVGNANSTLSIYITDNDKAPYAPFSSNATLTAGSNFAITDLFAGNTSTNRRSQFIYKAAELTAAGIGAGQLTGITLNITKNGGSSFVYRNLTIRMGQTTNQTLFNIATSSATLLNSAALTTVYSSDYTTVNGANTFTFSAPFTWNGTSSIVVTVCYDNAGVADAADDAIPFYSDDFANFASFVFQNNTACTSNWGGFAYYGSDIKPVINFSYNDPGTTVQTTLNTSGSEYLGPNADVYFYDQSNAQLMARIRNLSSHNYGCTQVIIDRAGTGIQAFQSSNTVNYLMDKTFRVVPTTNNASGQYEITLYYTQNEVNGWQTATGQSFNNIQLVKVPAQIKDATPATPNGAGTPVQVTPSRAVLGSNYTLMYSFSNGFSGFGAGVNAVVLPVRLTDIDAVANGQHIDVSWQTSSEMNSRLFEVERSMDGISFVKIGTVTAAGNSTTVRNYSYTDLHFTQPVVYYRIRIVDLDGASEYSKTAIVRITSPDAAFAAISPVNNVLYLLFGNITTGPAEIRILNISGQVVQQWKGLVNNRQRLSIPLKSNIVSGVYTVQVILNNQQFIRKIAKQ